MFRFLKHHTLLWRRISDSKSKRLQKPITICFFPLSHLIRNQIRIILTFLMFHWQYHLIFLLLTTEKTNNKNQITPDKTSAINEVQYCIVKNVPAKTNNPIVVKLAV